MSPSFELGVEPEPAIVTHRDLALADLAADEARLREALVSIACDFFWMRLAYIHVLRLADDARLAAQAERDRIAAAHEVLLEAHQRLESEYSALRKRVLKELPV